MKFGQSDTRDARARLVRWALVQVWARRLLLALAASAAGALVIGALVATSLWTSAKSESCSEQPAAALEFEEIITLKRRTEAWQAERGSESRLKLSGAEVTFLLQELAHAQAAVHLDGDTMAATFAVPTDDGCYNIDFEGRVSVADATATIRPRRLIVGDADLSAWVQDRRFVLVPERARAWLGAGAATHLQNTRRLLVDRGVIELDLYDRYLAP